jgi:TubC N-terminal docking domain
MTAAEIVLAASQSGVKLLIRDGHVVGRPAQTLPAELRAAVKEHKAELIELLTGSRPDRRDGVDQAHDVVETERIARLDGESYKRDGVGRGYGVDSSAHAERVVRYRILSTSPARGLIRTCREYGVGLRLHPDGTLVVESKGRAWQGLVAAIEAHVDDVAALVAQGWDGTDS